jgi:hypothetical protein
MLLEIITDPFVIFYLASVIGAAVSLTISIKRNPPEDLWMALPFYICLPLMPFIALASYPLTIYVCLKDAWNKKVRQESLRVRRK